jgi:four helix bundle protein
MAINQPKLKQLEQRTIDFSVSIVRTSAQYTSDLALRPIIAQLIRSATAIGANYAEANNVSSKDDYKTKIHMAKKEAVETQYWLKILSELLPKDDFKSLSKESLELTMIMEKILLVMDKPDER